MTSIDFMVHGWYNVDSNDQGNNARIKKERIRL